MNFPKCLTAVTLCVFLMGGEPPLTEDEFARYKALTAENDRMGKLCTDAMIENASMTGPVVPQRFTIFSEPREQGRTYLLDTATGRTWVFGTTQLTELQRDLHYNFSIIQTEVEAQGLRNIRSILRQSTQPAGKNFTIEDIASPPEVITHEEALQMRVSPRRKP